jgi:hypothetical protein
VTDERRESQRLNLVRPLDGWFGDWSVRFLDVSASGALIESDEPIPEAARGLLRFYWRGEEVELLADTVLRDDQRTGLTFLEQHAGLDRMIADSAKELQGAQEANASGQRERNRIDGDATLTAASSVLAHGWIAWTYDGGRWSRRRTMDPEQPPDGFTIPAGEPEDQVELLRQTYAGGDKEARNLTRMFAELSVGASQGGQ